MSHIKNEQIYGRMPEHIPQLVQDALQARPQRAPAKRLGVVLIAAILVVALACTALAMSIARSANAQAIQQGREVVCSQYGFTMDTIGLFISSAEQVDGEWVVTFHPIKYTDRLGVYTVTLPAEGEAAATWSHDAAPESRLNEMDEGSLDSEIWGPKQVARALALDESYMEKVLELQAHLGDITNWSLADRAELDSILLDAGFHERTRAVNVMPDPEDMQPDEAEALARKIILNGFGLTGAEFAAYRPMISCTQYQQATAKVYYVRFIGIEDYGSGEYDVYYASIEAETGELTGYGWNGSPQHARLPDGPLEDKKVAVTAFLEGQGFDGLNHAEKADLAQRLSETSYGKNLLGGLQYELPSAEAIGEERASEIATQALSEKYGLDAEMMNAFFLTRPSYQEVAGYKAWVIELTPNPFNDITISYSPKLGRYRVVVAADTGEVRAVRWSLEGIPQSPHVTDENWVEESLIWDADILARGMALQESLDALAAEYPDDNRWENFEYGARWSTLFREAGYDRTNYHQAVPEEGSLPREEAIETAIVAVCETFGKARETIDAYRVAFANYSVLDPEQPLWMVDLYGDKEDAYFVRLDAMTGEIVEIEYMAQGNG